MRHYLNLRILWAVLTEFATVGPYQLDWETQQYKCWISQVVTFVLLAALQALNLFWLFFVLRILWKYVVTSATNDETSDNEGEGKIEDAGRDMEANEKT
jgi:acyl-CoA-dependent ceramide synthase